MPRRGGKRRKTRTHIIAEDDEKVPKSMVVRQGRVGRGISGLVQDMRQVMLPYTALRLKEKRTTRLKAYLRMARQLNISHMLLFSQTTAGNSNMTVGCLPQGPSLSFRVCKYSLVSGVRVLQKSPVNTEAIFHTSPLIVMNNFDMEKPHIKLASATFQNMFPPINVATVKLAHCKRVVLLDYDKEEDEVSLRHFAITARPAGLSRAVRKLVQAKIPDLSRASDLADLVLGSAGMGPASDSEYEDEGNRVMLPERYSGRGNLKNNQSVIKLVELGPRMQLQLVKVEQGLCAGEVMYHKFVNKTDEQKEKLRQKAALKQQRRQQQEANVKRKRDEAEAKKEEKGKRKRRWKESRNNPELGQEEYDED